MTKLTVVQPPAEAERIETDDRPAVGSWWWVKGRKASDADRPGPGHRWLASVTEVGSNYVKVRGVTGSQRIALDNFHSLCESEGKPELFIQSKIDKHHDNVRELMSEIRKVCHQLGVPMHQALAEAESSSQALAVAHGTEDVKRYQKALVKAKDKTLPELFKQVQEQHAEMAKWMKAELIPAEIELERAKDVTEIIEQKIHTVELYAGLQEELVQVRKGEPAPIDTKVRLMQRRCYMDEECLARYEAGGMDFRDVKAFDKWLGRDENFARIFPHVRCIVAFRIRRNNKDYGVGNSLSKFIKFWEYNKHNKQTFLYIRNGAQLWRMMTDVEFGNELFPNQEDHDLIGNHQLWIKPDEHSIKSDHWQGVITDRQRDAMIDFWRKKRSGLARLLWQWHRAGKPRGEWTYEVTHEDDADIHYSSWTIGSKHSQHGKPETWRHSIDEHEWAQYQLLTLENIYHDDVMRKIAKATFEHNRIAVIVQGLLDRSTCLHPHPPWRIWTPEGFEQGIELCYDVSRALTDQAPPDFAAYKRQLNQSLKAGCHTWGQRRVWKEWMEEKYGEKWRWHGGSFYGDGPESIHAVDRVKRDGTCRFTWSRSRQRPKWVPHPDKPGYLKATYPDIPVHWECSSEHLICVEAYTPGDFRMFFDDPRTRADYIEWAPFLLSCEDWHHQRLHGKQGRG